MRCVVTDSFQIKEIEILLSKDEKVFFVLRGKIIFDEKFNLKSQYVI